MSADGVEVADLSLKQFAHLIAVAEDGTIAGAAARLGYSASVVAASLSELERAFGVQLTVRRRSRGVTLTADGIVVRDWSRRLLESHRDLAQQLRGEADELIGTLRIGCYDTLAPSVLPRLLAEFERDHPRVDVEFELAGVEALIEEMRAGALDAAVVYDMGELADFERHLLYRARAYAYFGAGHPLANQASVRIDELAKYPLMLFDRQPSTRHALEMFAASGVVPWIRHRTRDFELTRSIVARSSTAWGMFVQRPASTLSYDGLPLVSREISPPPEPASVVLAWPRDIELSKRAVAFLQHVRAQDYTELARPVGAATDSSGGAP